MKNITVNFTGNTIEISAKFAKAASEYGSAEYKELMAAKNDFPDFVLKVIKPNTKKCNNFKGLTTAYMEEYIKTHDDENKTIMKEFNTLRGDKNNSLSATASYGQLKIWFLNKYPEFEKMREDIEDIMKKVKEERKAKKEQHEKNAA